MALDLTSLALTVTDNLDGSVNWSCSGAGSGGSVVLFRAPWTVQAGSPLTWVLAASATANGSGVASGSSLSAGGYGFYGWMAARTATLTTADMLSPAIFRPVVDPADPIHLRVLDAVVSVIRALNLSGIGSAADKVFRRWHPEFIPGTDDKDGSGAGLPMVVVGPYPRETPLGYLTNRDDVGYPVLVGFYDAMNENLDLNMSRGLKWRRQVAAALRFQPLAGVPEVVLTDWQPDLISSPEALKQNYLIGAMTMSFRSRETRGLVA